MTAKEAKKEEEAKEEQAPTAEIAPTPTVKLPPATQSAKLPRSRSNDQPLASTFGPPTEPRGRGRGRSDAPRNASRVALPTFENRDPLLPFSGTRRARSPSPPPAWKAYAVRIAPRAPHKAPLLRNVKLFLSVHNPRPANAFSSNPLIVGINPRRLNRDEILIPKKFVKGVPQYLVKVGSNRISRRSQAEEEALRSASKPTPTVSISSRSALVRATEQPAKDEPTGSPPGGERGASGPRASGRGRGRVPDSGSWRRAGETPADAVIGSDESGHVKSEGATPEAETASVPKSKLPVGSSIGFYRPSGAPPLNSADPLTVDRSESAKMFMVTSELNGEKIAATPREETTAPGADLASRNKVSSYPLPSALHTR